MVVTGVDDQGRTAHLGGLGGDVDVGERLQKARRVLRRDRPPLQLVELVPILPAAVGEELRREHLTERRVVPAPPDPGELDVERRLALPGLPGPLAPAACVRPVQDHPAHPPRMANGEGDRHSGALGDAEEGKAVEPGAVDHHLEILDPGVEVEAVDGPVGHPAPPLVVAQQCSLGGDVLGPVTPHRALVVVVEVGHPVAGLDQRRAGSDDAVGDARSVRRVAEGDLLLDRRLRHRRQDPCRLGVDLGDELVAATEHRPDHLLPRAVVTDGATHRLDPARQCRLADEAIAPHVVEQLRLGDNPLAMGDEIGEDVEHLALDVHCLSSPFEPEAFQIEGEGSEGVRREATVPRRPRISP